MDEFNIDRISLGLFKIMDPQEENKYLLIPSWKLTGAYHINVPEGDWESFVKSDVGYSGTTGNMQPMYHTVYTQVEGRFTEDFPLIDYMEINALNASILEKKWF